MEDSGRERGGGGRKKKGEGEWREIRIEGSNRRKGEHKVDDRVYITANWMIVTKVELRCELE